MTDLPECLSGKGSVFDREKFLAVVQYEVLIFQEYIDTTSLDKGPSRIPGLKRIECRLDPSPAINIIGNRLTLVMDDGRKLDFLVTGENDFRTTGGIYS
jgi:hypothetical protein